MNEIFNPMENLSSEQKDSLHDNHIREIAKDEISKALSKPTTFKVAETGKTVTLTQVCRRCHEEKPEKDGYCISCFEHLRQRDEFARKKGENFV